MQKVNSIPTDIFAVSMRIWKLVGDFKGENALHGHEKLQANYAWSE